MKVFARILALGAAVLALSACSVAHVNNFDFNASESPEVRGPSTYVKPNENISRMSASLIAADEDHVAMPVKSRTMDEWAASRLTDGKIVDRDNPGKAYEGNNAYINIGGYSFAASMDFIMKWNTVFFQIGMGFYDGAYYYASLGANYRYFEYGVFVGEFHQFTRVNYYGYWCSADGCTDEDMDDSFESSEVRMLSDVFMGGYAGAHLWRFSLNYSLSFYTPSLDVSSLHYVMPAIVSNYLSLGFNVTDNLTLRGGAVANLVRNWTKPHLGLKFAFEYRTGESKPEKNKRGTGEESEPAAKSETFAAPAAETEPMAEKETPAENSAEEPAETESGESSETSEE